MLIFCTLLIFSLILWHLTNICWIDDKSDIWNMFYVHEKCKISVFKFSKVMQQHASGVVGNLIWILLEIYCFLQQWKHFANRSRIDKVIAMVRVAPFFDSQCIVANSIHLNSDYRISGRGHSPGLYPTPNFHFRIPVTRRQTCTAWVYGKYLIALILHIMSQRVSMSI